MQLDLFQVVEASDGLFVVEGGVFFGESGCECVDDVHDIEIANSGAQAWASTRQIWPSISSGAVGFVM